MDLYYCMGGGLGHLTRFSAFCFTTGVRPAVLTASNFAYRQGIISENVKKILPQSDVSKPEALREWVLKEIETHKPACLYIDAFPGGILGELSVKGSEKSFLPNSSNTKLIYIARILDWEKYTKRLRGEIAEFDEVILLEDLYPSHLEFLKSRNWPMKSLQLSYQTLDLSESYDLPENFWLIVHSGQIKELQLLWEYACETAELTMASPAFVFVSPGPKPAFLPEDVIFMEIYPATDLFAKAEIVFTGAGFNSVYQMRPWQKKHRALPFERALDDQFYRVKKSNLSI
jgi:hypothetical protein